MLLEYHDENDRVECENESDLDDADYVEVHSDDSHTEHDISSEGKLDLNEEFLCFLCGGAVGKDKESKWRENPIRDKLENNCRIFLCLFLLV